jgi:hypothetical protein
MDPLLEDDYSVAAPLRVYINQHYERVEAADNPPTKYLRQGVINEICQEKNIKFIVEQDSALNQLISARRKQDIMDKAHQNPKLFVVAIAASVELGLTFLKDLFNGGIKDSALPLTKNDMHAKAVGHSGWTTLFSYQNCVNTPTIEEGVYDMQIHSACYLPLKNLTVGNGSILGAGDQACVYRVQIDTTYCNFHNISPTSEDDPWSARPFALKKYKLVAEEDRQSEQDFIMATQYLADDHRIVKC